MHPDQLTIDPSRVPSPSFVTDLGLLRRNISILDSVQQRSGARVLAALKGFAQWSTFDILRGPLAGSTASGAWEALLGREKLGGEVHVYAPAFTAEDMAALLRVADHISFNTPAQWQRWRPVIEAAPRRISCGLRINPQYSEVPTAIYNPCAPCSRLGTIRERLQPGDLDGLEGLHFHTHCGQNSDVLQRTLAAVEQHFGDLIPGLKWVNFGGGHHITRDDYDVDLLVQLATDFQARWGVQVYLEPGEAVALNTGYFVATVLDTLQNDMDLAILDCSATCHMPDVLEMPYRPVIVGAGESGELPHIYRLGGTSCLAGDIIGDYSFAQPLQAGDRLVFTDMAHYSMVKTTTFNGVKHPAIVTYEPDTDHYEVVRRYTYADYRDRLS